MGTRALLGRFFFFVRWLKLPQDTLDAAEELPVPARHHLSTITVHAVQLVRRRALDRRRLKVCQLSQRFVFLPQGRWRFLHLVLRARRG